MGSDTVLRISNISKSYGKQRVLHHVDIEIKKGEIFGIVGSSGSGKSTLLEILTGNILPDSGEILFEPKNITRFADANQTNLQSIYQYPESLKKTVGYSSQEPSFYDNLTCAENLEFFGTLYGLSREIKKINSTIVLKLVGLDDAKNKLAKDLSGGMQKRLDLACSLIHDPKVLVLDEPTSDLDFLLRNQMWELIKKINKKGTTIIMSSHFLDEIDQLCDRIIIINNGFVEYTGSPTELKKSRKGPAIISVETVERSYERVAAILTSKYKKNIDISITDTHIQVKIANVQDEFAEGRAIINIFKKAKQTPINCEIKRETISDIFEKLRKAPHGTHQINSKEL
jgi:ABC-2 type transport system ATP-binding protein